MGSLAGQPRWERLYVETYLPHVYDWRLFWRIRTQHPATDVNFWNAVLLQPAVHLSEMQQHATYMTYVKVTAPTAQQSLPFQAAGPYFPTGGPFPPLTSSTMTTTSGSGVFFPPSDTGLRAPRRRHLPQPDEDAPFDFS